MNIKSLLLGSAAALVAVSGARAADAVVVAEPEPMEYVRVCDTYGAGFFYIPGTETCLRVGGYIRYDIGVGMFGHEDVLDKEDAANGVVDFNDTYFKRARAQLRVDARSETELGTLRAYMALNFQQDTGLTGAVDVDGDAILDGQFTTTGGSSAIDHALIELGGFRVGYTDSLFETLTHSAGNVINDDIVPYSPGKTHMIAYTFAGANGFSATVGLEEGSGPLYTLDTYMPHLVAGASFTQGWGGVSAVVGYDAVWEEWAGKVRVDLNATEQLVLFAMAGYKSGTDDDFAGIAGADSPNYYGPWGGDWAVWGGGTYTFNDKFALNVQLSYDEAETFGAVAGIDYNIVPGLVIRPEIAYASEQVVDPITLETDSEDNWGGYLRFQRTF